MNVRHAKRCRVNRIRSAGREACEGPKAAWAWFGAAAGTAAEAAAEAAAGTAAEAAAEAAAGAVAGAAAGAAAEAAAEAAAGAVAESVPPNPCASLSSKRHPAGSTTSCRHPAGSTTSCRDGHNICNQEEKIVLPSFAHFQYIDHGHILIKGQSAAPSWRSATSGARAASAMALDEPRAAELRHPSLPQLHH